MKLSERLNPYRFWIAVGVILLLWATCLLAARRPAEEDQPLPTPVAGPVTFDLPLVANGSHLAIRIDNPAGRLIREISSAAGAERQAVWDGTDLRGRSVADGAYYIRCASEGFDSEARVLITRTPVCGETSMQSSKEIRRHRDGKSFVTLCLCV